MVSHTGSFIFLLIFSIVYYLLYCHIWGKFSASFFITIISAFVIYILSLNWFPQIASQYEIKSSVFMTTGNFLATKFNLVLAGDLTRVLYENLFVGQELIYAVIFGAIIFTVGKICLYLHHHVAAFFESREIFPAFSLPIQNISHSATATPVWIGPVQTILSVVGMFSLDSRGKCIFVTTLICTLLPDWFQTSQGVVVATGALREVSYLSVIIPITATLGLWKVFEYTSNLSSGNKKIYSTLVWIAFCVSVIIVPCIATTYYLPKISGEDYIITGMQWLGDNSKAGEKAVGYGYRTVPIYTNLSDSAYSLQSGSETRMFARMLKGIYFSTDEKNADDFLSIFGTRYVMSSKKILTNFGNTLENSTADRNTALDKIYASNDFGVYSIDVSAPGHMEKRDLGNNISLTVVGTSYDIETEVYKVVLDSDSPTIERIGTPVSNILGEGFSGEVIRITGNDKENDVSQYNVRNLNFTTSVEGNRIIYRTILKSRTNSTDTNEASLMVRYRFYPDMIEREYLISNDWPETGISAQKSLFISTDLFTSMSDFIIHTDEGRFQRHIYESQDAVIRNDKLRDIFVYRDKGGLYSKYEPSAPYPSFLSYKGSTVYNMSSISISQSLPVKPGASLHVTQSISVGDETTAKRNVLNHDGIIRYNYPRGIIPICLTGYRSPLTDQFNLEEVFAGYTFLKTHGIPYTETVNPSGAGDVNLSIPDTNAENAVVMSAAGSRQTQVLDMQNITRRGIPVMGAQSLGLKYFDPYDVQKKNIGSLIDQAQSQGTHLTGFMPLSFNYNLDTIRGLSEYHIPLILAIPVNPPYKGAYSEGYRNPKSAHYRNERLPLTLLPVSYPMSSALLFQPDPADIFDSWWTTIDMASKNEELVVFVLRSGDIGNPAFSDEFDNLTSYAQERGLTFTTPDVIAAHYQLIQNIEYSGTVRNDYAEIDAVNRNPRAVADVTFKVLLPPLPEGTYIVRNATLIKNTAEGINTWFYISSNFSAGEKKLITIEPGMPREELVVELPDTLIEGRIPVVVKNKRGLPLGNVDVIVDQNHYPTDTDGRTEIELTRGIHTLSIGNPGYNPVHRSLDVKGRLFMLGDLAGISAG